MIVIAVACVIAIAACMIAVVAACMIASIVACVIAIIAACVIAAACSYNYCVSGYECMDVPSDILSCPLLTQSSLIAQVKLIGSSVYYPSSSYMT